MNGTAVLATAELNQSVISFSAQVKRGQAFEEEQTSSLVIDSVTTNTNANNIGA